MNKFSVKTDTELFIPFQQEMFQSSSKALVSLGKVLSGTNSDQMTQNAETAVNALIHEQETSPEVDAIATLFLHISSLSLSPSSVKSLLSSMGLQKENIDTLISCYESNTITFQEIIRRQDEGLLLEQRFQSLQWRLEVKTGSRCLMDTMEPNYLVHLSTTGYTETSLWFNADFSNMKHLECILEEALVESQQNSVQSGIRKL